MPKTLKRDHVVAVWVGILGTLFLALGAFASRGSLRLGLAIAAGVLPVPTVYLSRRLDVLEDEAVDEAVNVQVNRQLAPYAARASAAAETHEAVPAWDWSEMMTQRDAYPFVLFLGVQGAGKTTLAAHLQSYKAAKTLVVNKHVNFSQFPHADYQVEPGRDYDRIFVTGEEDETLRLSDLCQYATVECSFLQVIHSFIAEFNYRFSQRLTDLEAWDIWVDEVPALYSDIADRGYEDLWRRFLKIAMMEARKYRLRVFFIVQSKTVDSIGMKGLAALRDESVTVHLGDSAVSRGKVLKLEDSVMSVLKTPYRAAIVNDDPVLLPDMQAATRRALEAKIAALEAQLAQGCAPVPVEDEPARGYAPALIYHPPAVDIDRLAAMGDWVAANPSASKSQCLRALGYKGRRYEEGCILWNHLQEDDL
jgi:hypothetical protein